MVWILNRIISALYTGHQKLTSFKILLKQFSNYREEIFIEHGKYLSVVKLCINIIFKNTCDIQVCYKIMSFCDLSKHLAIILKSSRSNPQHLETNFVPFSHKTFNTKLQWKEVDLYAPLCWTHHHILWQNSRIVSLSYHYLMHLSLFIKFIYIAYSCPEKFSYEISGA